MRNTNQYGSTLLSPNPASFKQVTLSAEGGFHHQQFVANRSTKPPKPPVRRRFAKTVLKSPISLKHGWLSNAPHMFWQHARDVRYDVADSLSTCVQVSLVAKSAWTIAATSLITTTTTADSTPIISLHECDGELAAPDIRHEVVRKIARIASASSLGITDESDTPTSLYFQEWLSSRHSSTEPATDYHSSSSNNSQGTKQQLTRAVEPRSIHVDSSYYQIR